MFFGKGKNGGTGSSAGAGRAKRLSWFFLKGRDEANGAGPGGNCECPDCGKKVPHTRGIPCSSVSCPNCGSMMIRK